MTQVFYDEQALPALHDDLLQLDLLLKEAIAKLSGSFIGAHQALTRQQALPDHANPECVALAKVASAHLDSALTALQFEDIASQLIASARNQLLGVGRGCSDGRDGAGSAGSAGGTHGSGGSSGSGGVQGVGGTDGADSACCGRPVAHAVTRSVPQQHMESGSIELF